jgi:hypothetical protein
VRRQTKHTNTFTARSKNGAVYRVNEFTEYLEAGGTGGFQWIEGIKSLKTADGEHLNRLEKGKYQVVLTGETLESDDPTAP